MDCQELNVAFDEFEIIEELIRLGQISPDFMVFLRGLMQMSPKRFNFDYHWYQKILVLGFLPFVLKFVLIHRLHN